MRLPDQRDALSLLERSIRMRVPCHLRSCFFKQGPYPRQPALDGLKEFFDPP